MREQSDFIQNPEETEGFGMSEHSERIQNLEIIRRYSK